MVQRLGQFQILEIDPKEKRIFASIILKGEGVPIQFDGYYEFINTAEASYIKIVKGEVSKEWIHEILQLGLEQKDGIMIPIPQKYSFILKFII